MSTASNDSLINETVCPVPLELLATLLRMDGSVREDEIKTLAPPVRARLAFFCYNRVHLRTLAFDVALSCELRELRLVAGVKGDLLYAQAEEFRKSGGERSRKGKVITLARRAVG